VSRKGVIRFCDNDMRRNKTKAKKRIWKIAAGFRERKTAGCVATGGEK
jgi:hypothetical protein